MRLQYVLPVGVVLAVVGCAQPPQPVTAAPQEAVVAPQQAAAVSRAARPPSNRRARVCEKSRTGRYVSEAGTLTAVTVSNEGAWCGNNYTYEGHPFTGGEIIEPPRHGEARVRHTARRTIIEYRPTAGYVGTDRFTATLTPGTGTYIEEITVKP